MFCEVAASVDDDDGRTLAISLGTTLGGLLVILLVLMLACYATRRCSSVADSRRARILRAEMALDGDNAADVRLSALFPRYGLLRTKPRRPSSEHVRLPSAPEQTNVYVTELDAVHEQPTTVRHLDFNFLCPSFLGCAWSMSEGLKICCCIVLLTPNL